ncbi:MAG: 1,2-phenylacetyl-CoA epoxidase subunit PaaD [Acetobacteraceae bacterium]
MNKARVKAGGGRETVGETWPRPDVGEVWRWLDGIPDPEIPAVSVVDLGMVRDVRWEHRGGKQELVVTVTPTYSGCPAASVIMRTIEHEIRARGVEALRLERRIAPPWTTDWISPKGRQRLEESGIAPPSGRAGAPSPFARPALARLEGRVAAVTCPRCGSENTMRISEFGSTPCKAQYRCRECLEPFDYFKCI